MDNEQLDNLIIKTLEEESDKIKPDERLLVKILSAIDAKVTTFADNRFIFRSDKLKGRASINNENQIYNLMTINWKLMFGVIVLAVIAAVSYYQFILKPASIKVAQLPSEAVQQTPVTVVNIIPATGSVDDAVLALLNDSNAEASILADINNDANLLIADSQAIDDFGQSYNEEF